MESISQTALNDNKLKFTHPFLYGYKSVSNSKYAKPILNLNKFPYLADHSFQDMIVLPGSVYLEMALAMMASSGCDYNIIKEIRFQNLYIVPAIGKEPLYLSLVPNEINQAIFQCNSKISDEQKTTHATMFVEWNETVNLSGLSYKDKIREIQKNSIEQLEGETFYSELIENGNQYGPHFQGIKSFWLGKREALGRVEVPSKLEIERYCFHPALLDCCTHVLCATKRQVKQTFVLEGIDQLVMHKSSGNIIWSYARQTSTEQDSYNRLQGSICLLDEFGNVALEMLGVKFRYVDFEKPEVVEVSETGKSIVVSSTFTAEPLADSLDFWRQTLEMPLKTIFAPYNQIFQQLLNDSSETALNKDGMNVILIQLEDWIRSENGHAPTLSPENKERLLSGKFRYTLPNKLEIAHLNEYETEYLYKEIFVDKCYLRHGIEIHDGDCIIDIGANIGVFSLFVQHNFKNIKIYAFEPAPPVSELMEINTSLYGTNVSAFNCGISDCTKEANFTFYEKSSVFSGFMANEIDDAESIRAVIRNMLRDSSSLGSGDMETVIDDLMQDRLNQKTYTCQLKSLSDVIDENKIEKIDLIKVDAEKSELDILKGIRNEHWKIIKQIVIEVHDKQGLAISKIKQLLQEKGFGFEIEEEQLLQASGLYNIYATCLTTDIIETDPVSSIDLKGKSISKNSSDFLAALKYSISKNPAVPYLVCFCPASPGILKQEGMGDVINQAEARLLSDLANLSQVYTIRNYKPGTAYNVEDFYDAHGDQLGHVPYTSDYFAALGSMIVREFCALQRAPYKVVVLDCDNTLWQGVVGEDGVNGIKLALPFQKLQKFMVKQMECGMLICLCSKNVEEDVVELFNERTDMPLKRNHIVSWRINWLPKSENIKSLAAELQLGLDSFIFIDDNPVECAEVAASCPEVLTLLLPEALDEIPSFLEHVWAFDCPKVTAEDTRRTALYQQNIKRETFRKESLSLEEFLAGLDLKIVISEPEKMDMPRVSQLTYRTNQFNFTTIRRSETEILELWLTGKLECLITKVSDRFGDYGLVGVILFERKSDSITIDTFLLSCRVLGRGVEYRMMAKLGEISHAHNLNKVVAQHIPTRKNLPAKAFLKGLKSSIKNSNEVDGLFSFPANYLKGISYKPHSKSPQNGIAKGQKKGQVKNMTNTLNSDLMSKIARDFNNAEKILNAIESVCIQRRPDLETEFVVPGNEMERAVVRVWQKVLGISEVGIYDNFSDMGGTSLKGVQLIALLKHELNLDVSIVDLFEFPNVSAMAQMLVKKRNHQKDDTILKSRTRGEKRRAKRRFKVS